MEAFMYRHHPQIKRARELLDEGSRRAARARGVLLDPRTA
jgi:predicted dehydrogenase